MPQQNDTSRLYEALRAADAAGNTADARRIAEAIRAKNSGEGEVVGTTGTGMYIPPELRNPVNVVNPKPPITYDRNTERARQFTQGTTFGAGDEIGAAIAAVPGSLATGESYGSVYSKMYNDMAAKRGAYKGNHPYESLGLEMAGGIASGVAEGQAIARSLPGRFLMRYTPRAVQAGTLGAVDGGIYGAMAAEPGNRLEGGASGAVIGGAMAPVVMMATDAGGQVIGAIRSWARDSLASTPRSQAIQAIREALVQEGLDPETAVQVYNSLGPEGMLADMGENSRALARAATDTPGPFKTNARATLDARQAGSRERLLRAAEGLVGQRADDLTATLTDVARRRSVNADAAYGAAWNEAGNVENWLRLHTPAFRQNLETPAMQTALRDANRLAANELQAIDPLTLQHLHYAKMALDDQISTAVRSGQNSEVRTLMGVKNRLLAGMDAASPTYRSARQQFASETELLNAGRLGREALRTAPDTLRELVDGMSPGELEMFRMGAMAGVSDYFDNMGAGYNASARLTDKPAMARRLAVVFGDENRVASFLDTAANEAEMFRTRAVVTGGSPTSQNLAGQGWLSDAIQPSTLVNTVSSVASGNPVAMMMTMADSLLKRKPLSSETLQELSGLMLQRGVPEQTVRQIMRQPRTIQMLNGLSRRIAATAGSAGASAVMASKPGIKDLVYPQEETYQEQ